MAQIRVEQPRSDPAVAQNASNTTQKPPSVQQIHTEGHKIGGSTLDILWALTCLGLPMLVLTAIFLGLVYGYEISNGSKASTDLLGRPSSVQDSSAYYVDYSATRLATVSSWTSTVTSFTVTFIMVLVSYPLAKDLLKKSKSGGAESLPTTYQLSLIIGLLQGGFGPLWSWLQYCFWRRRAKQTALLWLALLSVLGGMALSFGILGADTWLHIVTTTVQLDVLSPPASQPALSYGRQLIPKCYNQTYSPGSQAQCIGDVQPPSQFVFYTASEATRTTLNLSTNNAALLASLEDKNFAYLTAAQRNPNMDFRTSTYALSTTCSPAAKTCNLHLENVCISPTGCPLGPIQYTLTMPYNCSADLYGDLYDDSTSSTFVNGSSFGTVSNIHFFLQLFQKQGFSDGIAPIGNVSVTPNPFYFTIGGAVDATPDLANDPDTVASNQNFNSAFMLNCTATIYELDYTSVNGTVVNGTFTKANQSISDNLGWTFLYAPWLSRNSLESAFISGAQETNSTQEFADYFAREFSRSSISMLAGITDNKLNDVEQLRESRLVTRLPKAPFFTLIILNLLFATVGIILAIIAFASQPKRVRDIQARLSTAGLVAALLEPHTAPRSQKKTDGVEGLFAESFTNTKPPTHERVIVLDPCSDNRIFQIINPDPAAAVVTEKPQSRISGEEDHILHSVGPSQPLMPSHDPEAAQPAPSKGHAAAVVGGALPVQSNNSHIFGNPVETSAPVQVNAGQTGRT